MSNLEDLSNSYGSDYESLNLAYAIYLGLSDEYSINIHKIDLRVFIAEHMLKCNELSQKIASDFKMN